MNSLKRLIQNLMNPHKARLMYRSNKKLRPKKPKKERLTKEDKTGEKVVIVALPQLKQMPIRSQRAKKRINKMVKALKGTFLRSPIITAIKKTNIPRIVPSQKTSCSLGNFYIGDY